MMNSVETDKPNIMISGVSERDIDLLLLGECVSNPEFVQWLVNEIVFTDALGSSLIKAERSATQSIGESDIELFLENPTNGKKYLIMIENKIATNFQPRQAERYMERGNNYITREDCISFRAILLAPKKYIGSEPSNQGFNTALSYEKIIGWFEKTYTGQSRLHYLSRMLNAAIEKSTFGWQHLEDEPVTVFWHRYWEICNQLAPELEMPEPSGKPAKSSFIYFHPILLPREINLCHKVTYGNVDLQFAGYGNRMNQLSQMLGGYIGEDMKIVRAAKSAAVSVKVHQINMTSEIESNIDHIAAGILTAKHLLGWYTALPKRLIF
jgi:hypothetical protein